MPIQITIDQSIRAAAPDVALGAVSANVEITNHDAVLRSELEAIVARLHHDLAGTDLPQLPEIQALRRLYRGLGKDPTRYRGSSEALLRRIVQGKGLFFINTAVDVCNLVSVETRHSLGAYDLDRVAGAVTFRRGEAGEVYSGIGRGQINLEDLPVFSDARGPFGSPTSDSERTMITLSSRRIALVIIACCGRGRLEQDMERTADLLRRYTRATEIEETVVAARP